MIDKPVYARLPFESSVSKRARCSAQPEMAKDELFIFLLFRPFSIFISRAIVGRTSISANQVTGVMAMLGLGGPAAIAFCKSVATVVVVSAAYVVVTSLLDAVDGEVARLRAVTSRQGVALDVSLWFYYPAMFVVVVMQLCSILGVSSLLPILIAVGSLHELYSMTVRRFFVDEVVSMKQVNMWQKLIRIPFSKAIFLMALAPMRFLLADNVFNGAFVGYTMALAGLYFLNASALLARALKSLA